MNLAIDHFLGCVLQTLNEEDEELDLGILEDYRSPFTRLFEDEDAMACWHDFIEKSEEEQAKIMKAFSKRYCGCLSNDDTFELGKPGRISSRLRRTIKIRKNLSLEIVKVCEEDLITFFKTTPSEVYEKVPPTSFDRLLIHAIAQYHQLKSTSKLGIFLVNFTIFHYLFTYIFIMLQTKEGNLIHFLDGIIYPLSS